MASEFYYLFFLLFTILCFIPFALLYVLTVKFDRERVVLHRVSRIWSMGIYRLCPLWRLKVAGREKIDRGKAYVIVTNHQSMLDVPLMYVLPLNFKWVSKREVMRIPIFGWVLQMHGDIAIERGSSRSARHMMEEADDYLSRGTSVTLFPEGTRTKTGRMGRFKEGAADAAHFPCAGAGPDSARRGCIQRRSRADGGGGSPDERGASRHESRPVCGRGDSAGRGSLQGIKGR